MPSRILREGIIESEPVNALSAGAELLYRRLMSKVDDFGRFHAHPALILSACYPLQLERVSKENILAWLKECERQYSPDKVPLISTYEVDGKKYLVINNFGQRTRAASRFPEPPVSELPAECARDVSNVPSPRGRARVGDAQFAIRNSLFDSRNSEARAADDGGISETSVGSAGNAAHAAKAPAASSSGTPLKNWQSDETYAPLVAAWRSARGDAIDEDFAMNHKYWTKMTADQQREALRHLDERVSAGLLKSSTLGYWLRVDCKRPVVVGNASNGARAPARKHREGIAESMQRVVKERLAKGEKPF